MRAASGKTPIFLVEDDVVDVEAVTRALKKVAVTNPLIKARDGAEALDMLTGDADQEKIPQPCILLLDINMPRMNGLQLLRTMRADEDMKRNVVFMLTTSAADADIDSAYDLQVAGYFLKENLEDLSRILADYCNANTF